LPHREIDSPPSRVRVAADLHRIFTGAHFVLPLPVRRGSSPLDKENTMGIFNRKGDDKNPPKPASKAEFSNVRGGSSSTAPPPATPAPFPAPAGAGAGKSYTVVAGDSLSKIAKREYGDANAWTRIYEANRDIIKDPDLIHPGQTLKIPAKS
jgi:nucleoid-associated protein YgaU